MEVYFLANEKALFGKERVKLSQAKYDYSVINSLPTPFGTCPHSE